MNYFSIYDKTTGAVLRSGICTDPQSQVMNITEGVVPFPADPGASYVKNGVVKEYPTPAPEEWFEWDLESETWVNLLTPEELAEAEEYIRERQFAVLRAERDKRLLASDWTDTPSAQRRLAPEVFEAWAIYRQALRDMPLTTDDPFAPEWPISP